MFKVLMQSCTYYFHFPMIMFLEITRYTSQKQDYNIVLEVFHLTAYLLIFISSYLEKLYAHEEDQETCFDRSLWWHGPIKG